jgi:hypothetical protein
MKNSIQIWCEAQADVVEAPDLNIDINVWHYGKNRDKTLLDFGLKVFSASKVKSIYIYFPFPVGMTEIEDLGYKMRDQMLLNGIFNEHYTSDVDPSNNKRNIIKEKGNSKFVIYEFSKENLNFSLAHEGTVLQIRAFDVVSSSEELPIYFRIRIKNVNYRPFFEVIRPKNSIFESAFMETELVDFRINELRNQDRDLIERIARGKRFKLTKINFFMMTPVTDSIETGITELKYERQLEKEGFWDTYLDGNSIEYGNMSVYTHKRRTQQIMPDCNEDEIEDYRLFAKIRYHKANKKTIAVYLAIVLSITIIANIISNVIWSIAV